ncbi:hypothetical protein BXO88_15355 [Oribacterium sp. C9]|uniref:sulfatase-like hydrolase/transferase n=1 Tax=Oribacterium sp. C9 TaxID=1943579 RepID=UPI0009CE61E1|nr:sulfatase-like hydrolase/transferase [Oribacterium sp. C9]OON84824.1 hypothetical protein BXO88_15355 [Oribacterium sp. C9]
MNYGKSITAVGLTASLLATQTSLVSPAQENTQPKEDKNYNVLFIVTDQEHYFSEYPVGSSYKARELLSEMGTTFEKHYTCSNMSTSSRSVMFTGKHITDTGMIDNTDFEWQGAMDDKLTTVGDMMREAGYYSALKGKWHLGDASILHGGAELTDLDSYGYSDWGGTDYIGSVKEGNEMDPRIVSEAVEWLETKGKSLNATGTPFFLNINLINPHDIMNYDVTGYKSPFLKLAGRPDDAIYNTVYNTPVPSTWNFDFSASDVPDALRIFQGHWGLFAGVYHDENVWKDYQNYYFNCIQDSDNNLMKILDYLKTSGMLDDTVIVFTSDHGEMHGSHGMKGKGGFLYENNVHVPLIIVHPDYKGGRRISALTSHVDLAPTLVDITGISHEEKARITSGLPGKSLLPLMDGRVPKVRDASLFCFEMLSMTGVQFGLDENGNITKSFDTGARGMVRGITTDRYKFVRYFSPLGFNTPTTIEELYANNDVQLFDLWTDPDETVNLAQDKEANAELIMQMNALLNKTIQEEIGQDDGLHVKLVLKTLKEKAQ